MPSLTIIDTGHGNCAIVEDGDVAVVDAPKRAALLQHLDRLSIDVVSRLIISHADADHIDGAATLLTDKRYTVEHVYVNPDPARKTAAWDSFKVALGAARQRGSTTIHSSLNSTDPGVIPLGSISIEVISPSPEMAISGPRSKLDGRTLTENTNSAVLLIKVSGERRALLAADLDDVGLELLIAEKLDLTAPILVFPHHGGRPGKGDPAEFASRICDLVSPQQVVFSIGRGMHGTPRPEIVDAVRRRAGGAHLACTQLSKNCEPHATPGNETCAGTITIDLATMSWLDPTIDLHRSRVDAVTSPMCRGACYTAI